MHIHIQAIPNSECHGIESACHARCAFETILSLGSITHTHISGPPCACHQEGLKNVTKDSINFMLCGAIKSIKASAMCELLLYCSQKY